MSHQLDPERVLSFWGVGIAVLSFADRRAR
jgi:hypothetical protein